jgi:hypothetical protein
MTSTPSVEEHEVETPLTGCNSQEPLITVLYYTKSCTKLTRKDLPRHLNLSLLLITVKITRPNYISIRVFLHRTETKCQWV